MPTPGPRVVVAVVGLCRTGSRRPRCRAGRCGRRCRSWLDRQARSSWACLSCFSLLAGRDQLLHRRRGVGGEVGVADQRDVVHREGHAVDLAVEGDRLEGERLEVEACRSGIWTGSMVPFWTRLPIQSWAPITTSGRVPCLRGGDEVGLQLGAGQDLDGHVTPFSSPNASASAVVASPPGPSPTQISSSPPLASGASPPLDSCRHCRSRLRRHRGPDRRPAGPPRP